LRIASLVDTGNSAAPVVAEIRGALRAFVDAVAPQLNGCGVGRHHHPTRPLHQSGLPRQPSGTWDWVRRPRKRRSAPGVGITSRRACRDSAVAL